MEKRWTTMKQFYKRIVSDNKVLVCRACEKKLEEPMLAARVVIIFDGPSLWAQCLGCGERERVGTAL
jgi:RNase P subunit RPR2